MRSWRLQSTKLEKEKVERSPAVTLLGAIFIYFTVFRTESIRMVFVVNKTFFWAGTKGRQGCFRKARPLFSFLQHPWPHARKRQCWMMMCEISLELRSITFCNAIHALDLFKIPFKIQPQSRMSARRSRKMLTLDVFWEEFSVQGWATTQLAIYLKRNRVGRRISVTRHFSGAAQRGFCFEGERRDHEWKGEETSCRLWYRNQIVLLLFSTLELF